MSDARDINLSPEEFDRLLANTDENDIGLEARLIREIERLRAALEDIAEVDRNGDWGKGDLQRIARKALTGGSDA